MKRTKGKWHIEGTPHYSEEACENAGAFSIEDSEGNIVAQCYAYSFYGIESIEQAKANAQLIATAPEMLEGLHLIKAELLRLGILDIGTEEFIDQLTKKATEI